MSSTLGTRPRATSRKAAVACDTAGCKLRGQKDCHSAQRAYHIAEVRNRDDYSVAVVQEGDEGWRVRAYIPDHGTKLSLSAMTALAADLSATTVLANSLNRRQPARSQE